eukprot:5931074-Pleurochrysis_carterae.AAC.1
MVAFVAVDVEQASRISCRSSSRLLPAHAAAYARRAAWLLMVSKIECISLRSIASNISGAKMNRFDWSGLRGGGRCNALGTVGCNGVIAGCAAAGGAAAPVPV